MYEGGWKCDVPEGYGVHTYENGDFYRGQWKGGLKHGCRGEEHIASKGRYEGEFREGLMHGFGVFYYTKNHGDRYEGMFLEG